MPLIVGIIALLAGCILGWAGRYAMIEPDHLRVLCAAASAPAWCAARELFIDVTFRGLYGPVAVAAAAVSWVTRGRCATFAAVIALFAGGLGLYLYDTSWAASGVLAALLRLPRIGDEPPDPREFSA